MSTRQLSSYEVFDLIARHADLADAVQRHEQAFLVEGHPFVWDQTATSQAIITTGGDMIFATPVPIPPRGVALVDEVYGNVIVFPDAHGLLHFNSTTSDALARDIQRPVYVEDPDYWEAYESIAKRFGEAAKGIVPHLEFSLATIAVIFIAAAVLVKRV